MKSQRSVVVLLALLLSQSWASAPLAAPSKAGKDGKVVTPPKTVTLWFTGTTADTSLRHVPILRAAQRFDGIMATCPACLTRYETDYLQSVTREGRKLPAPVFLTATEAATKPGWTDWNRVSAAVTWRGASGGEVRSFFLFQLFSNRTAYAAYVADAQNYCDLTLPPENRTLTRPQVVEHWADLPRKHYPVLFERDRVVWLVLGISPSGMKIGDKSASKPETDKAEYFIGSSYLLNPYALVTAGFSTLDGRRYYPTAGVGLDFGVLGEVFK